MPAGRLAHLLRKRPRRSRPR